MVCDEERNESKTETHQHIKYGSGIACRECHVAFSSFCNGRIGKEISNGIAPCENGQSQNGFWNARHSSGKVEKFDEFVRQDVDPEDPDEEAIKGDDGRANGP